MAAEGMARGGGPPEPPPGASGAGGEGVELLGRRLRAARAARGIGVRELARLVGCSASLISQVEHGHANPSVGTLYALSSALGISLDDLFSAETPGDPSAPGHLEASSGSPQGSPTVKPSPSVVILRRAQRDVLSLARAVQWQLLLPVPEDDAEFLEVLYAPGGGSSRGDHAVCHPGREYGLVLEGSLSILVGGCEHELAPGDSLAFDSTIPHRLWNPTSAPARAVFFVSRRR